MPIRMKRFPTLPCPGARYIVTKRSGEGEDVRRSETLNALIDHGEYRTEEAPLLMPIISGPASGLQ